MKNHKIPLGALVEVDADYLPEHGMRLFVGKYSRDCDGTPLYDLTHKPDMVGVSREDFLKDYNKDSSLREVFDGIWTGSFNTHWGEESLKVIKKLDTKEKTNGLC